MKQIVLALLRGYKWLLSPLLLPSCRYVPTCSEYAMEAVDRYGAIRGGLMAALRVLRCHPFVKGGFDPVVKEINPQPTSSPTGAAEFSPALHRRGFVRM
jgi:uncharacterized protein